MGRRVAILVVAFCSIYLIPSIARAGYTVTLPGNAAVTMGDANGFLPFTVTNNGPGVIRCVRFYVPRALYYIEFTSPAPGWTYAGYGFSGSQYWIRFRSASNLIPVGSSQVFNVEMKGPNWGNIVRSNIDQTDALTQVRAYRTFNCGSQRTFTPPLPNWQRKALKLTPVANPSQIGIGDSVTLEMQVENRATVAKKGITAVPSPPMATGATFTNTGGPTYNPNPLNLAAGGVGTITYTYDSSSTGQAYFTAIAVDGAGTSSSKTKDSNIVYIRDFTASLSFSPLNVTSGGLVTVTMAVGNNGITTTLVGNHSGTDTTITVASTADFPSTGTLIIDSEEMTYTGITPTTFTGVARGVNGTSPAPHSDGAVVRSKVALGDITPTLSHIGSANDSCTGPIPTEIISLPFVTVGTFEWQCTMNGPLGQTIQFQGNATAQSPAVITSNTATSEIGAIVTFSIVVGPPAVASGSTNVTIDFTITNRGGQTVRCLNFYHPNAFFAANFNSSTATCGFASTTFGGGLPGVRFYGGTLPNNSTCTFSLNYNAVPTVTQDTSYAWPIDLYRNGGSGGCNNIVGTVSGQILVTLYEVILTHSPAGPIDADGTSQYTMTTTLTLGGTPVSGKTISFQTTDGTLSSSTAVTDGSGQVTVMLTAPVSSTDITATVTATYVNAQGTDSVDFTGVVAPILLYVGGSLTPLVVVGGGSYSFTLDVKNFGTAPMNLDQSSFFTFTDGTNTATAFLDVVGPATIPVGVGAPVTLTFGSAVPGAGGGGVVVPNCLASGVSPTLQLNDGGINDQTRTVSDQVAVVGSCVTILHWQEVIP